ncbi:MAG: alpha/beta hydrolase [Planctomycetia bacterium]|nr:alpha/beta hydrolase [Planctomycetia bacterium]
MNWRDFQQLQRVVELHEHFLSYVDHGNGKPVVLVHGIPTWGYLWHGVSPVLAETHRVLIPDMLGFGYSDKRDSFDRSISRQAEVIDAWMGKLGIETAAIVGHDIGGGVALRLATLFPNRVDRLCVLNTVCYDSWPIELMLQFGHPDANRKLSASAALSLLRAALKQGFARSPQEDVLDGLLAPYRTEVGKLSLIRNAAALNTNLTTEISDQLLLLDLPTLVLWGEDDTFQAVKYGQRLARDIPRSQFVRINDARHFVMFDQPDQVVAQLVSFLGSDLP